MAGTWHSTANPIPPDQVAPFGKGRVWWACKNEWCGKEWIASIANRGNGSDCPRCRPGGFDSAKPGWLYIYVSPDGTYAKFGITNGPRLRQWDERGWERRRKWEFSIGVGAAAVERRLKDHFQAFTLTPDERPRPDLPTDHELNDGYTEMVRTADISVDHLAAVAGRYVSALLGEDGQPEAA